MKLADNKLPGSYINGSRRLTFFSTILNQNSNIKVLEKSKGGLEFGLKISQMKMELVVGMNRMSC